jgi:hypothetical protein
VPAVVAGSVGMAGGLSRARAGQRLDQGIGCSRLPIRINAPPELTFFTLQSGGHHADPSPAMRIKRRSPRETVGLCVKVPR